MAIRFLEGFDYIGALNFSGSALQAELLRSWDTGNLTAGSPDAFLAGGWGGGFCLDWSDDSGHYLAKVLTDRQEWWVGFAYCAPSDFTTDHTLVRAQTTGGSTQCYLMLESHNRHLRIIRGSTTLGTGSQVILPGHWYYIEVYFNIDDTAGAFEVKINGVTDFSGSSIDTRNVAGHRAGQFRFVGADDAPKIDDIYIVDTATGASTFLGPIKVEAIYPTSDDTTGWNVTPAGSHYAVVDEKPGTGTDYVYESVAADQDMWGYSNLATVSQTIKGIQIQSQAALDTAGSEDFTDICDSNGVESASGTYTVTSTSYNTEIRLLETDPNTSATWTVSGVNAAKFGVKRG